MGFSGFWGRKSRVSEDFGAKKGGYFDGFSLIDDVFWVK